MRIVGGDQRNAGFLRNPDYARVDIPLLGQTVVLNFQVKIALTEDT